MYCMYGAVAAGRLVSNVQNVQRIVDGAMWPVQMEKRDAFFFFLWGSEDALSSSGACRV
jgi:hypothetical protein